MPTTTLMPLPKQQFLTALGTPLVGGKVYTYAAGTSKPKETFTDAAGSTPQPNPIPLNLRGEPASPIYWSGNYRVEVRNILGELIYTVDNYNTDPAGVWGSQALILDNLASGDGSALGFMQDGQGAVLTTVREELVRRVNVMQFSDDDLMDGLKPGAGALQAAVNHVYSLGGGVVEIPAGTLSINTTINCYPLSARRIIIRGGGRGATTITTTSDITLFEHAEYFECHDMSFKQLGAKKTGRVFSTPLHKQAAYCNYERLEATDFKFFAWWRYSLWNTINDVSTKDCAVTLKGSRNALPDDQSNPGAPGGWNQDPGYFHNKNTISNLVCDGGEVGVWGTFQSSVFDVTCQNQIGKGADNKAAPIGTPGVGLWLQNNGNDQSAFGANANTIVNLYCEYTQQPLVIENAEVSLSAIYAQGSSSSAAPFEQAVRVSGPAAELNARGVVASGSDYFKYSVVDDAGTIYGNLTIGSPTIAEKLLDRGAKYYDSSAAATNFNITIKSGDGAKTIFSGLNRNRMYTITIGGVYDGFLAKLAVFNVFYLDQSLNKIVMETGGDTDIQLSISGAALSVTVTNANTYNLYGTVMDWLAEGNAL